jgi:O-succinylbenzoic acid--CoA ligase
MKSMQDQTCFFIPDETTQKYSDQPALLCGDKHLNYQDYARNTARIAGQLTRHNLPKGSRIALLGRISVEYPQLIMGVIRAGFIAAPLDDRHPPAITEQRLRQIDAELLLVQTRENFTGDWPQILEWEKLLNEPYASGAAEGDNLIGDSRPVSIIFTSGSSQEPKAVVHTYGNHYYSALGSNSNIRLGAGDCWLLCLPLHHVSGLAILFRTALAGAAVRIPEPGKTLGETIRIYKPSHISLVAAQLIELLSDEQTVPVLTGMKAILLGGGPIPPDLVTEAKRRKLPVHISYGSTEMASQITTTPPQASMEELQCSGRILPHRELMIDKNGEIKVRGKSLCVGYWRNGKIIPVVEPDGWFSTGDIGLLDAQNNLRALGRKDRMFISGGENIYPEEIELAVFRTGLVNRVCVVAVSDPKYGRRPAAFIQMKVEPEVKSIDWKKLLHNDLPAFKIPVVFLSWPDDLPAGIKTDYRRMQDLANKQISLR